MTVAILAGCSTAPTPTPVPTPPPVDLGPGPPANDLETTVVRALDALGIKAQRVELPFREANMWAQFDGGLELFVSAYPADINTGDVTVLAEREIAGLTVQRVEGSGPVRDRFACGDANYGVYGAVPPGFADMQEFLARFIEALDCP